MDGFTLTIFPQGGLAGSIITTVWVGMFVMCLFNLRFGWVLSGLVVPGYVVPLMIVKPFAALVIVIEAVVAYWLVWLFSEKIAPGRFPSLFGRDRFTGLILSTIAVRLSFDGFILPEFAIWLDENFDRRIDWQDNLQSFGLVVVALLANQFWKPGLSRGIFMVAVTFALTYVIIRYGLMEFTNFQISGAYHLYEGLASSIHASPKAYIILTLTALIASHYNVKYGWDFSGILIPALIALQWYQPEKIVTSFGEAIIIYCVARLILSMPFMANVTVEGGRKLLLFFNISFAWKILLGWSIIWLGIDVKSGDYFGFGYLLSTLIAIKAHDKDIFPRLARSTLQVSLAGAVMGNIVGFGLSATTARLGWDGGPQATADAAGNGQQARSTMLVDSIGGAYANKMRGETGGVASESELALAKLIELLERGSVTGAPGYDAAADGWRVRVLPDGLVAISHDADSGTELLLHRPAARRDLSVVVVDPTRAPGLAIAAHALFEQQQARWLVIGASAADLGVGTRAAAEIFQEASASAVVQVATRDALEDARYEFSDSTARAVDLAILRATLPGLAVSAKGQRSSSGTAYSRLWLDEASLGTLATSAIASDTGQIGPCRIANRQEARAGWENLDRLAFIRFELAEPMVRGARDGEFPQAARAAADLAGMQLERCHIGSRIHYAAEARARAEGSIFLAEGVAPERAVLAFDNGMSRLPYRIGAAVHRSWESDALFIATRSDSFLRSPRTVHDVIWQEWVRSHDPDTGLSVFQLRARPAEAMNYSESVDVLIARDRVGPTTEAVDELPSALRTAGLRAEIVSNTREQAGVEAKQGMTGRYLDGLPSVRFAFGWLLFDGIGRPPA